MKTNTLMDNLISQTNNPSAYPNVLAQKFNSLTRNLQSYWDVTYGLNDLTSLSAQLPGALGPSVPQVRQYLVISVQGKNSAAGVRSTSPQSRNIIFIANQVYNPQPGETMILNTPKNVLVSVTLKVNRGNGAFEVNGDLVQDVLTINGSGFYPYVQVTLNASTGL